MKPKAAFFPLTLLLLALTACGQKGPLYLPEDESAPDQQEQEQGQQQESGPDQESVQ